MNKRNNQAPTFNNQTMTNNQIQITKQKKFGDWLLRFGTSASLSANSERSRTIVICLVIVSCLLVISCDTEAGRSCDYTNIVIRRAVDGDTLQLEDGERVRLIGIDTPEIHESNKLNRDAQRAKEDKETIKKLGMRAFEFTKGLVEGKRVSLEFDVEKRDRYNRLLAYVYLKDGTFVNAEIVKQGFASLMTYPPNVKYADLFLKLYREARENRRGLWK